MWVEKLTLENIKCFDKLEIAFGSKKGKYPWITLLGENGGGKSTILQALGLLLAGPEGAPSLVGGRGSLQGWLNNENKPGKISVHLHKDDTDPGELSGKLKQGIFDYSFYVTGSQSLTVEGKAYSEPTIVEKTNDGLTWLRSNALMSKGKGWFGAGYGPYRRLLNMYGQRIRPSEIRFDRFSNFLTLFDDDEGYSLFESWMIWLDYQVAKNGESGETAARQMKMGVTAINRILANYASFEEIDDKGNILFNDGSNRVQTQQLSDGFRSALAFTGDLLCRIIEAFPQNDEPLHQPGVVLIDELDVHLHPRWQRKIPGLLRDVFPNVQFIVATHSPLIAAGAGKDAMTYKLSRNESGEVEENEVKNIAFKDVDNLLRSPAFGLPSTFSPDAETALQEYLQLKHKEKRTAQEEKEFKQLSLYAKEIFSASANLPPEELELRNKMAAFIKSKLSK